MQIIRILMLRDHVSELMIDADRDFDDLTINHNYHPYNI